LHKEKRKDFRPISLLWDESEEVLPGENWAKKIGDALEKSDAMVVLESLCMRFRKINSKTGSCQSSAKNVNSVIFPGLWPLLR
jgi:hypothetical protein